ncbi:16S rRNA (adenine(1518)-N(6)/adenine(1519)-N(6))-dimethyltransferase RsmA [Mycoplasma sp. 1654_15]|uniref:16S rRNA (adenine(1518)-N(6)/adenine(1519)-N(6))- dimethyltransferase RsmA n=1 Tax=Mycoplasma sp. 1654_15 TaxID=2725994 RepID=UPI00144991B9|nr:16S rRNA (adenine(1518)-N(6)/adenine(1519)-N(6))-dimethyltransferase RsmA [Mycoplasma sp. 1654_15]QJB71468.1 16S rRNA (adenine(1518)-N(6)/adenine(1519)-N(6))-dimethyltransferase RsmA [Mycoplasma sp. 1654_15]
MNNIKAKKKYGQNFLKDNFIIQKIIELANPENQDILEIGPGLGAITIPLLEKAKSLLAYEIDAELIEILKNKITSSKLEIKNEDFLKADLNFNESKILVANLPYYITSDILFKIFENLSMFSKMVIMVQEEVADRIVAKEKTSNFSKLSLACQLVAEVKKELKILPSSFVPQPKVNSALVTFEFKKNLDQQNIQEFFSFTKKCFSMKRKTFYNNLSTFINEEKIKKIFNHFSLNHKIRPQEISLENYKQIFEFFKNL